MMFPRRLKRVFWLIISIIVFASIMMQWRQKKGTTAEKPEVVLSAFEKDREVPLATFIEEISSTMERFPYPLVYVGGNNSDIRFRGTLTFERYLLFYRYKNRVLEATRDEMDECVVNIDSFSPKGKALVLVAVYILDQTRHKKPLIQSDSGWIGPYKWEICRILDCDFPKMNYWKYYRRFDKGMYSYRGMDPYEAQKYVHVNFYPYSSPFMFSRFALLLGKPRNDKTICADDWKRWITVFKEYKTSEEVAFSPVEYEAEKLEKNTYNLLAFHAVCAGKDLLSPCNMSNDSLSNGVWNSWRENIDRCVEMINTEFHTSYSTAGWVSDVNRETDAFLLKIHEMENRPYTPKDKLEMFLALREYWLTFQGGYNYTWRSLPLGCLNDWDIEDNDPITLGEIVRTLDYNMM